MIKPYLNRLSRDELLALIVCSMATIAGLVAIMPDRRHEVVEVTFTALLLGNIATLMTVCIVSLVL